MDQQHSQFRDTPGAGRSATDRPVGTVTFYEVLDLLPSASRMEIREAYLRLKSTYGGDGAALYSLISEDEARQQLIQVEEAYQVLYDDLSRRAYDERMGIGRPVSRPGAAGGQTAITGNGTVSLLDRDTERLLYARSLQDPAVRGRTSEAPGAAVSPADDSGTVRTSRSTLAVVKLQANGAAGEDIRQRMQELINSADPGDGDLFRRLRELCGVSVNELQDRSKVGIGYIQAIETNRFDRLPQAVYVKGFLRSFFRYLSVPDAEKLISAFSQRLVEWQTANRKI